METTLSICSRKRKQCSSSTSANHFSGALTRSKSQIHFHRSRSGRAWPDNPRRNSFQQSHLFLNKALKKPRNVVSQLLENETSLDISIKDLRARARRIFSPTTMLEEKRGEYGMVIDFSRKDFNGTSKVSENGDDLDLEFHSLDPNSDLGFHGPGKEEGNDREDVDMNSDLNFSLSDKEAPDTSCGSQGQQENEEDLDLNKLTPQVESKNEDRNIERWNGTISTNNRAHNSCQQRKVFKTPSSFSYRRLLPFIMDMTKGDSCISKLDVVDIGFPCKIQNSNMVESNSSSVLEFNAAENEQIDEHCQGTMLLDKGDVQNTGTQLPVTDDPIRKMARTEGNALLSDVDQRNNENALNGINESIEQCLQTTPPDETIFTKLNVDAIGSHGEVDVLQTEYQTDEKSSERGTLCKSINLSRKSDRSPIRKIDTISKSKPVLNPCSHLKIFKSSSFSYRRLLPFLMDVAKSTPCVDQYPKFQKDSERDPVSVSSSAFSDNHAPGYRTKAEDSPNNQNADKREPNLPTAEVPPTDVLSDDISPNLSTQFFSSNDNLSEGKLNSTSFEVVTKPVMPLSLQTEMASEYGNFTSNCPGKLKGAHPNDDMETSDGKVNGSAKTSCCTTNSKSLPREYLFEVSQCKSANHEKHFGALGLDYHKGGRELIRSVSLKQSLSQTDAFDHQGDQSYSPTKGILRKNPRGCRGLCNCLNCSSFRLHAERAFEFSRNQMLDAEEVTLDLINELTKLRYLLQTVAVDGGDLGGLQLNQVEEACRKAVKTEQLAKQRLIQMNDDLNIHCRVTPLQRPRVTFSRDVEQKAIVETDL